MDIFSHELLFCFPIDWPGPFFLFDELSQTTAGHCVPFPPPFFLVASIPLIGSDNWTHEF